MAKNLRDTILEQHTGVASEIVPVDAWGVDVEVRELTAAGRDEWDVEYFETYQENGETKVRGTDENIRARFLVRTLYDPETGERIFQNEDADRLGQQSNEVIGQLFRVAQRLNGIQTAEAAEDAEKN